MAKDKESPRIDRRKFLAWGAAAAAVAGATPLLAACSSPAAPQQPAPGSAPAPAVPTKAAAPTSPPAKEGVIELKLEHHEPAEGYLGKTYQKYADTVAEKSGGKIHITVYPSETLAKAVDSYPSVLNGIADLAWVVINFIPGQFPRSEAFMMPMLGIQNGVMGAKVASEYFKTNPDVQKEWSEVKVLATYCNGVGYVFTAKKKITTMDDIKGLKLRCSGFGPTQMAQALGASPVSFPPPELYENLSKGVVDAYFWDWQGVLGNRTYELSKYMVDEPIYNSIMYLVMNKKKWDGLTPDLQKIMEDPGLTPSLPEFLSGGFDAANQPGIEAFKKYGNEILTLSPEEKARWKAASKPAYTAWIEQVKGKGIDGQQLIDQLTALVNKYKTT